MKKSVQAGKYIVSDFIASSVVWLLFNLIRYEEVAVACPLIINGVTSEKVLIRTKLRPKKCCAIENKVGKNVTIR